MSAIFTEIRAENITFMAGSIAYHAFVSLLPLLVLLLSVAALLNNQSIEQAIFDVAEAMLSRGAGETLIEELKSSTQSTSISLLGAGVLLWGGLRIFRGLDTAFSDIYETEEENTFLNQLLDGFVVLAAVGIAIVAAGYAENLVRIDDPTLDWVVGGAAAILGLMLAFLPMYFVFPDTEVTVREVIPGSLFAAVGLATFESLFSFYIEYSSRQGDEGSIVGGIIVLLTWLYFSGLVILVGVVINAVLANRSRDINVEPVFGGGSAPAPNHAGVSATRDELVGHVEALEELLESHDEIDLRAGTDEMTVPSPTHVIGDTRTPLILGRGRPVRLELQWTPTPEPEQDAGAAEDDGTSEDAVPAGGSPPDAPASPGDDGEPASTTDD